MENPVEATATDMSSVWKHWEFER